jgi:hypothetical protein
MRRMVCFRAAAGKPKVLQKSSQQLGEKPADGWVGFMLETQTKYPRI